MTASLWLSLAVLCAFSPPGAPFASAPAAIPGLQAGAPQRPAGAARPASARTPIDIPEGTPVIFHLYGGNPVFASMGMYAKSGAFFQVIQVDQDTVVDGVVVIPRGSLGEVKVAAPIHGRYHSRFFNGSGTKGFSFTPEFVLSAASTRLDFVDEAFPIDLDHKNAEVTQYGVVPLLTAQFTAKLKHASITM